MQPKAPPRTPKPKTPVLRVMLIALAIVAALLLLGGWRQFYDAINNTNTATTPSPLNQAQDRLVNSVLEHDAR